MVTQWTPPAGGLAVSSGDAAWSPVSGPEGAHLITSLTSGRHSASTSRVTVLPGSLHRAWASGLVDRIRVWPQILRSSLSSAFTLMDRSQPFWLSKICSRAMGISLDRSRV